MRTEAIFKPVNDCNWPVEVNECNPEFQSQHPSILEVSYAGAQLLAENSPAPRQSKVTAHMSSSSQWTYQTGHSILRTEPSQAA
jgi:hypothetical protein